VEFTPEPVDLLLHPSRPGEICEIVDVHLAIDEQRRLASACAAMELPAVVVMTIAVEAERVLDTLTRHTARPPSEIEAILDGAAVSAHALQLEPVPLRPLGDYRRAILAGGCAPRTEVPASLAMRVPLSLLAAWSLAAALVNEPLAEWVAKALARANLNRVSWEAAATAGAQSLESWAAVAVLASG